MYSNYTHTIVYFMLFIRSLITLYLSGFAHDFIFACAYILNIQIWNFNKENKFLKRMRKAQSIQ